mmetsp:Transcript_88095/g.174834  ORF Transcript_88095/g.174834 Transcript_88095/m.174834 type:complete len:94 (-) Transcript_88095:75-356(-)
MAQTALQVAETLLLVLQHCCTAAVVPQLCRSFVLLAFLVHHHPVNPACSRAVAGSAPPHCGGDLRPHLWGDEGSGRQGQLMDHRIDQLAHALI